MFRHPSKETVLFAVGTTRLLKDEDSICVDCLARSQDAPWHRQSSQRCVDGMNCPESV